MREVTVLVSDLRGFTTLCERLAPAQVTEAMNEYLTAMVDRILAHRGMVSDFIGDGILAFFGAPVDDPEHPWHAVQTALEMQAALEALNARWTREGKLPLAMGIAVTLYVLLGNVYERTGLAAQAAEAFDEAQLLSTRGDVPAGKP